MARLRGGFVCERFATYLNYRFKKVSFRKLTFYFIKMLFLYQVRLNGKLISWHEERSSIRRFLTGTAQNGTAGPNTKLSITHSFFELQTPDLTWKFLWILRIN